MNVHIFCIRTSQLMLPCICLQAFHASEIIVLFFVFLYKEIFRFLSFDE